MADTLHADDIRDFNSAGDRASPLNAKASIVTVDTLFHNPLYEIPSYQREFSWGDKQVEALIGDLVEAYHSTEDLFDPAQYFLGAIVTQERQLNEAGEVDIADKIVDGQQRFTSLILLIAVLCKSLASDGSENRSKKVNTELETLISRIFRADRDHFVLDVPGYNYYLRQLMGANAPLPQKLIGQPPFRSAAIQKFNKAFKTLEDRVLFEIGRVDPNAQESPPPDMDAIAHFSGWLRQRVFVALIADTDPYDDQRLFDRMNTRGLPLSESERFKSRVLAASGNRSAGDASRRWQKHREVALKALNAAGQTGSLAVRDAREAERRLMGGWLVATQAELEDQTDKNLKKVRSIILDPYDFCLETYSDDITGVPSPELYKMLKSKFWAYTRAIKNGYVGVYKFQPELPGLQHAQIAKIPLIDAAIAACYVTRPVKLASSRLHALSGFLDVVAFHKGWNQHWSTNKRLDRLMLGAINLIRTSGVAELRSRLATHLGDLPSVNGHSAPSLTSSNGRWMRYLLGRMAYELEYRASKKKPSADLLDGKGNQSPEIEHILSKRFNENGEEFEFDLSQINTERQRLGALTLLSRQDNRAASNRAWSDRCRVYSDSNLLTRTLLNNTYDHNLNIKGSKTDLSVLEFRPWSKISPTAIAKRQHSYSELSRLIWSKSRYMEIRSRRSR